MQRILMTFATLALVACSQKSEPTAAAAPSAEAEAPAAAPAAAPEALADACALVPNPEATFGQPVTTGTRKEPNNTTVCEWKSSDGRICGSLNVFGPGYNQLTTVQHYYDGMTTSLKAFGEVKEVSGIGEAAKSVDGGLFGAQLAFRTSTHVVLTGSACSSGTDKAPALAEKLAREVAPKL